MFVVCEQSRRDVAIDRRRQVAVLVDRNTVAADYVIEGYRVRALTHVERHEAGALSVRL
jgi:hypothetical protein